MREKVEVLEHHADLRSDLPDAKFGVMDKTTITLVAIHGALVNKNGPSVGRFQVVDDSQQGALACTARADEDHYLSSLDL